MKNKIYFTAACLLAFIFTTPAFAQSNSGDAELSLEASQKVVQKNDEFTVDILLKNPGQQKIISVRTWLEFDSTLLEGISIDTANTPFNLAAPNEDEISNGEGLVKIGRSNILGGFDGSEDKVATVKFKALSSDSALTSIKFYNYQIDELGNTSVNIIDGGLPLNILGQEPEGIEIQLNGGATKTPTNPVVTPQPNPVIENPVNPIPSPLPQGLLRPSNLKANTGNGYIDLIWEAPADINRTGFNVYYGRNSGAYTRKKVVGNQNSLRLDNLNNGETFYLAVRAYDRQNQESEYSNEVGIIVNQPLSSTHPFETLINQIHNRIPEQPQNGPMLIWLLIPAAGFAGKILKNKK